MVESVKHRHPPPKKKQTYHTFILWRICFDVQNHLHLFPVVPGKEVFSKVHVVVLIRAGKLSEPNLLAKLLVIFHQVLHLSWQEKGSSKKNPAGIPSSMENPFVVFLDRIRTFHGLWKNHDIFLHIFVYQVLNLEVLVELGNTTIVYHHQFG